jgi:predicted MFS family arabinose efflux permease
MRTEPATTGARRSSNLRRRLLPLYVAAGLQGFMLWTPVEKLFLNEIGFDAAAVGLMAAAYAAIVPLVEVPSGLLADRWSRRGVLIIANLALLLSVLIGGLSHDVATYIGGALVLGVYFAMYSGTMDAIVYDTVLTETENSDLFERMIGRARAVESAALVASSLAGGLLAGLMSARTTYFLSLPFTLLSILALLRFTEPTLHQTTERVSLRAQIGVTFRTVAGRGRLLPVVALSVLTALISQVVFEFGPLWLVALSAAPWVYGPFWAALVSTLGLGGLLAGRLPLERPAVPAGMAVVMALASAALSLTGNLMVVAVTQVVLVLLAVALSIHVARLLHDTVPSSIRAGVASGVGAFSWIAFLPFALIFGLVSRSFGVGTAAWMITGAVVLVALTLVADGLTRGRTVTRQPEPRPAPAAA